MKVFVKFQDDTAELTFSEVEGSLRLDGQEKPLKCRVFGKLTINRQIPPQTTVLVRCTTLADLSSHPAPLSGSLYTETGEGLEADVVFFKHLSAFGDTWCCYDLIPRPANLAVDEIAEKLLGQRDVVFLLRGIVAGINARTVWGVP